MEMCNCIIFFNFIKFYNSFFNVIEIKNWFNGMFFRLVFCRILIGVFYKNGDVSRIKLIESFCFVFFIRYFGVINMFL